MYFVINGDTDEVVARRSTKPDAEAWVEACTSEGSAFTFHIAYVVATNRSKREWSN